MAPDFEIVPIIAHGRVVDFTVHPTRSTPAPARAAAATLGGPQSLDDATRCEPDAHSAAPLFSRILHLAGVTRG